jgi:hypothetical protein
MSEPDFIKSSVYVTAPEPMSAAYFINPSRQSVCLYVYLIVARLRLASFLSNVLVNTLPRQRVQETV